ncbi:hypothetical protein TNCV_1003771 [Trichonephila clavipes]|nr:hypothetical protein TNCV_1003771 [Trichonephila clavipes]
MGSVETVPRPPRSKNKNVRKKSVPFSFWWVGMRCCGKQGVGVKYKFKKQSFKRKVMDSKPSTTEDSPCREAPSPHFGMVRKFGEWAPAAQESSSSLDNGSKL